MTHNPDIPLSLLARNYLNILLRTQPDSEREQLADVVIYLNNLITEDELKAHKP